jgi:hypothetical protein
MSLKMMSRKPLLALTALVMLGAVAAWLLNSPPARSTEPSAPSAAATTSYSLLSRPTTAADTNVTDWKLQPNARLGTRPAGARVVYSDAWRTVAAVPSNAVPCLVSEYRDGSQSTSCGTTDDEMTAAVSYLGSIGLVPDSVQNVTYTMTDGSQQIGGVKNNLWQAPSEAKEVTFTVGDKEESIGLMPASSMPKDAKIAPNGTVMMGTPPPGYNG